MTRREEAEVTYEERIQDKLNDGYTKLTCFRPAGTLNDRDHEITLVYNHREFALVERLRKSSRRIPLDVDGFELVDHLLADAGVEERVRPVVRESKVTLELYLPSEVKKKPRYRRRPVPVGQEFYQKGDRKLRFPRRCVANEAGIVYYVSVKPEFETRTRGFTIRAGSTFEVSLKLFDALFYIPS